MDCLYNFTRAQRMMNRTHITYGNMGFYSIAKHDILNN